MQKHTKTNSLKTTRVTVFLLISLILSWLTSPIFAHEVRPAIVDLNLQPGGYEVEIQLSLEVIMADINPELQDTDESENASRYNQLRALSPEELVAEFSKYQATFLQSIDVRNAEGNRINHQLVTLEVAEIGDLEFSRDTLIKLAPSDKIQSGDITWSWAESYGTNIIRVNKPNQGDEQEGGQEVEGYSAFLAGGERSADIPLSGEIQLSAMEVIWNYLVIGFTHILPKGLDHILFVVGLFLLSPRLRPLLIQVTSFTFAHTVTLAMGATGVVQISPGIVEPLIAASIVYVAIENIFSDKLQKWRPFIVFGFGLLHGLGFAGVLAEIGIASSFFITALLSFNVGVEFGQLAVIAICFLSVGIWFGRKSWYRKVITIPASLVVAVIAAYWFVERTFLA